MQSRFLRYLVIAVSILWYAVIVPGHQRGVVTLGGGGGDCCSQEKLDAATSCCANKPAGKGNLPAPLRGPCAICDQTAKMTPPPVFDFSLRFAGLLAELEPARVFTLSGVQFVAPVEARGPPRVA